MKICCIVGSVPTEEYIFPEERLLIAADSGYAHLKANGITPDVAVGDFDSLGFVPDDVPVIEHPIEKDDTDTILAVKEGLQRGCKIFLLYGCVGGDRLDHTVANLQTLAFIASQGGMGFLLDAERVSTVIRNSRLMFDAKESGDISVFCFGEDAEGVTIKGLHYSLTNATLRATFPLAVSNHFEGKAGFVSVKSGTLLVIWSKKTADLIDDLQTK